MKQNNKQLYHNQSGFTLMVLLAAFLVLFTTISFIRVSSLEKIDPDLRRIGINIGPNSTPNPLAESETTNPNLADSEARNAEGGLSIASNSLNIDADVDIESEGDNPTYIE